MTLSITHRPGSTPDESRAAILRAYEAGCAVLDTADLIMLARRRGNRALDLRWVEGNAIPDGLHLLRQVMAHGDGTNWRCNVMVNVVGSDQPVTVMVDVTHREWDRFRTDTHAAAAAPAPA